MMAIPVFIVFGMVCFAGNSPDATSQIKSEIERLQRSLKANPVSDSDLPDINKMLTDGLKGAAETLSSGRIYLSLEMLGREWDLYSGARSIVDGKAEVTKGGLPSFDAAWNQASLRVASLDRSVKDTNWNRLPVAIQALAQSARLKVRLNSRSSAPLLTSAVRVRSFLCGRCCPN